MSTLSDPVQPPLNAPPRRWRPWHRTSPPSLPTTVLPDPMAGVLTVSICGGPEPGCDPILFGLWATEFRSALNATPRFRVVSPTEETTFGAPPLQPGFGAIPWNTEPGVTPPDLKLQIRVRSIDPYRPMRIDADLLLQETYTQTVLARLDGVWEAPVDSIPLKPTRRGLFRRDWKPVAAKSEAVALEANSPRMFLRGTAQRMATSLTQQFDQAACTTESGW